MKIIFFAPYNISENIALPLDNAPRIRCKNVYKALQEIGEVILIGGDAWERRGKIKKLLKKNLKDVDGLYMENPNCSLKRFDFDFLKKMNDCNIPMSMFYRDAYWKFSNYAKTPYQKLKYNRKFSKSTLQLNFFLKTFNTIYSPTREFAGFMGLNPENLLPPAGEIHSPQKCDEIGIYFSGAQKDGFDKILSANEILLSRGIEYRFYLVTQSVDFVTPDNFSIYPIMSNNLIDKIHIGIIPLNPTKYYSMAFSLKFMQYLSYGIPVICQRLPAFERYHDLYNICRIFDGTSEDLAENINELVQNETLRKSMSQNALDAVKNKENWNQRVEVIISGFKKVKPA